MELDDLKNTWIALDNRLKQNNVLNETIIKKMAENKVNKSLNKLIFWDVFSIVICMLLIPFNIYWFSSHSGILLFGDIIIVYALIICISLVVWYIIKVNYLIKFDFTENTEHNIYNINKYTLYSKREKLMMYFFIGPSIIILCMLAYAEAKATIPIWALMISILIICSIINYFSYKKIYKENIDSIRKSLEEINELKEKDNN